jgi:thiamine-phosphate pyrophosphorylase
MKLIIMTKSTFFVEEDKILTTLFDEGLDNLHLYKPGQSPLYSERLLSLLPEDYYRKITVHDHFYLKSEYNLAGIHLDDESVTIPVGYKGHVGRTCTQISQLKEAKKSSNYVFLRNIADNKEFNDGNTSFALQDLQEASRQGLIDKKVYATGGMSIDSLKMCKDLGFGGIVISSDLWDKFDIHNQNDYKDLITHFEKLRKTIG